MGSTNLQDERQRCITTLRAQIDAARSSPPADAIRARSRDLLERLVSALEGKQEIPPRGRQG